MSLKPFTYPFPETRFFHTGYNVYKFKIRYGSSIRKEERKNKDVNIQELEDSVRVVLGNLDSLQPFTTEHFIVFPYKSKWERVSHLRFLQGDVSLVPYPFVFTLYVEMKRYQENLSPEGEVGIYQFDMKKDLLYSVSIPLSLMPEDPLPCKPGNNSPIELLGATLEKEEPGESVFSRKVPAESESTGTVRKKRKLTEAPSTPRRSGLDRAQVGAASQLLNTRKPPMKTGKEGKAQHEWQEAPTFGILDVQDQEPGSEVGDIREGQMAPSVQQINAPPPEEPAERGAMGFFGFLSSLFPFRFLFRKTHH